MKQEVKERKRREYKVFKAKISYDGTQFLVRIPQRLAMMLQIEKGDLFEFKVEISNKKPKKSFEILKGTDDG